MSLKIDFAFKLIFGDSRNKAFIDSQSRDVMEMLAARNHDIGNAFDLLQIISKGEKARMAYEAREAELMDQRTRIKSAFAKGEEIGINKGEAEIIRALLAGGMPAEDVSAISGMDITRLIGP